MMRQKTAWRLLEGARMRAEATCGCRISWNSELFCGEGKTHHDLKLAEVGTFGIPAGVFAKVSDSDVVKTGVAVFHEARHLLQSMDGDTPVEIGRSIVSTFGNRHYYLNCRTELPHEIDAEFHGISDMWDYLADVYPEQADGLMLDYVNVSAASVKYMVRAPEGGFLFREQVEEAFSDAYDRSLSEPRGLHPAFRRYPDRVSRMMCEGTVVRPEYQEIFDRFIGPVPGKEKDRMMAALSCRADPTAQGYVRCLDREDLSVAAVFGVDVKERKEPAVPAARRGRRVYGPAVTEPPQDEPEI